MKKLVPVISCLVLFHAPDGTVVSINTSHIIAVRPATEVTGQYLAPGTSTIIYTAGQKFGVKETQEEAETYIKECGDD